MGWERTECGDENNLQNLWASQTRNEAKKARPARCASRGLVSIGNSVPGSSALSNVGQRFPETVTLATTATMVESNALTLKNKLAVFIWEIFVICPKYTLLFNTEASFTPWQFRMLPQNSVSRRDFRICWKVWRGKFFENSLRTSSHLRLSTSRASLYSEKVNFASL